MKTAGKKMSSNWRRDFQRLSREKGIVVAGEEERWREGVFTLTNGRISR
jgi:hypothetical protein